MLKTIPDLLSEVKPNVRCISADVAAKEREQNNGLLIDVREPAEHAAKPAVGAINIPRGLVEMKLMEIEKDPQRPIYLHCATSARAMLSAEQLARVGYTNVTVITCDMDTIQKACC
ncbi:rhodanese-like domain-containing protein [Glaciecola sp. XM2]|jgi:rhodanese-related sulfurtransferase|uniref:rhodanese-like domain-containing protein n=1 Tax=Glaciecola sp. XM2 TaxID=1914931 RepID=UPI001BDE9328|nr:rhodanese-like domain-containing protein [Glaciecola sp. XM2]MBT1450061.1 rhodanese-like domain-containing protein [Glaciecola sp. XM2]